MKTVGWIILIGAGLIAVWYFLSKKVEAAEDAATDKINALTAGLKGSVAGVATALGTGLKSVLAGKTAAAAAGAAAPAAGAVTPGAASAGAFVGPVETLGMGTEVGGAFGGMAAGGIVAGVAAAALILFTAFKKIFPSRDPEWDAIERKLQEAREAGKPILNVITKAQLKAPTR